MKKLEVFDPPMCCSTGVCGPTIDPDLVRFTADLHWLANQRVAVERFNLAQQPQAFADCAAVKTALTDRGNQCLPLILLDGSIVSEGRYPTRDQLALLAGLEPEPTVPGTAESTPRGLSLQVINTPCC